MPTFGFLSPFSTLNLHKIGNAQKPYKSYVIKVLRVQLNCKSI
jgi:hypothetical protein